MKLFFLPYAGGTSLIFSRLKAKYEILNQCEIIPIDIPGRGQRMAEPLCKTIDEAAEDLARQMTDGMIEKKEEYAIFAHSMGCILAYELMYKLEERGYALPTHVFFSGKNAPDIPTNENESIDQKDNETIIQETLETGFSQVKIYQNKTMANLFILILRADVKLLEEYICQKKKHKLPIDIIYFFSTDDPELTLEHVKHWQDFITGSFHLYYFQGGHFFIVEHEETIIEIMVKTTMGIEDCIPY